MSEPHDPPPFDRLAQVDYWLNKPFFDLQQSPAAAARWRQDRAAVLRDYPVGPDVRSALLVDDIAVLARHSNAYLLRFYFSLCGMTDADLIRRLRTLAPVGENANG